jgi:hypothetical protein
MAKCESCGNEYDKAFTINQSGKTHVFDSFECRDPAARTDVRALRLPDHRPRARRRWSLLLLRALRQVRRRRQLPRPGRVGPMQESENGAADIGGEILREALAAVRCRLIRGIVRLGRNPVVT